ncbi:Lar family restriction alleviation protein [Mesorhizobium carmichaelinearum]|uniref:Lar family restriction alleviation protein n=1 Tax=Mesorhizobium carmichaelinearum TaxID=1208188 RepID=UPI00117FB9D1|nr:Lar family restriction alleviation protein [Mesorhizobium carmichaelinearum]
MAGAGELKPCPFCEGQKPKLDIVRDGYRVHCTSCGSAGAPEFHGPPSIASSKDRAIAAWNRRATRAPRNTAWLIERKDGIGKYGSPYTQPHWYAESEDGGWHWWTPDANEGKQFASKAEAEAFPAYQMIATDPAISVTDHVFLSPVAAQVPAVKALWQELLEKDDRTSPAEYPDMALITFEEFAAYLNNGRTVQPVKAISWPEPKIANPDIPNPTGVPYIDCLLHRLLDAQQDINLAANERMDQSLCDASALIDETQTAILAALSPVAAPLQEVGEPVAVCRVMTMQTSAGDDHFVSIERAGRQITPHKYRIKGRAEYDVAEWNWVLNGGPKPHILDFDTAARSDLAQWKPTHRHLKRGNPYRYIGAAKLQSSVPLCDKDSMIVYQAEDGSLWVRPHVEFYDGRFEPLSAAPEADHG